MCWKWIFPSRQIVASNLLNKIKIMDFYRQIAPIKWLTVVVIVLATFDSVAECSDYDPEMVELNCRYDTMTGGRMCDCKYRDEVMNETIWYIEEKVNNHRKQAQYI